MATVADEAEVWGLHARDEGDIERAAEYFHDAFIHTKSGRSDGARARRAMLLGEVLAAIGDFDEAEDRFSDALTDALADPWTRINTLRLASALRLTLGRLAEARLLLDEALSLLPDGVSGRSEVLDLRLHAFSVLASEGQLNDEAVHLVEKLADQYAARGDVLGTRGLAYCRLLNVRIAIAKNDPDGAADVLTALVHDTEGVYALRRLNAQAHYAAGEAHMAFADFELASKAFRRCEHKCLRYGSPRKDLRRVWVEAKLGAASALRALHRYDASHQELMELDQIVSELAGDRRLQVKYLHAKGLSFLELSQRSIAREARNNLALARSMLRQANLVRSRTLGTDSLGIQIANVLSSVQHTLGRHHQSISTLEQVRHLADSATVSATDRGDFLSGLASTRLRVATDLESLNAAAELWQEARDTYSSWYDLARIDQNLSLVDARRAELAQANGSVAYERIHLKASLDRLIPALLAKFAVRFTLSSQEVRQDWNNQQARGLEVALDCALRLHFLECLYDASSLASKAARVIAGLIAISRVQGVLTPTVVSDPPGSPDGERTRVGALADNPAGTGVSPAVADLLGVADEPAQLAPAPRMLAPDGHVVLEEHFDLAVERYCEHGLDPQYLYRQGHFMRL